MHVAQKLLQDMLPCPKHAYKQSFNSKNHIMSLQIQNVTPHLVGKKSLLELCMFGGLYIDEHMYALAHVQKVI